MSNPTEKALGNETKNNNKMTICWVLTNNYAGIINQALGLAEQLPVKIIHKKVTLRPFWHLVSPYMTFGKKHCMTKESAPLTPPWPDLVIAAGRQAILPALYIKEASQRKTKIVYLQDPVVHRTQFDAIVCPAHDAVKGNNIIPMIGTTHRVTPRHIAEESEKFRELFAHYPLPRIAVLIGGPNKTYTMSETFTENLAQQLYRLQRHYGGSLLITTSRRTPPHVTQCMERVRRELGPCGYLYTGEGPSPYFALLGWGEHILLTCDSVCMISETCSTTKPVYLIPLEGRSKKFQAFHSTMLATGRIQWFDGTLQNRLVFEPFNENIRVAQSLREAMDIEMGFLKKRSSF